MLHAGRGEGEGAAGWFPAERLAGESRENARLRGCSGGRPVRCARARAQERERETEREMRRERRGSPDKSIMT